MNVSKSLNVIKYQPSDRNDHQKNEGNGNKQNGCSIDTIRKPIRWMGTNCKLNQD